MPTADYYRKHAQICGQLALISNDPAATARYNTMALEHLARAAELDRLAGGVQFAISMPGDNDGDKDPRLSSEADKRALTCPRCGRPMRLDRVAAHVLTYSEDRTYTCPQCWGDVVSVPERPNDSGSA